MEDNNKNNFGKLSTIDKNNNNLEPNNIINENNEEDIKNTKLIKNIIQKISDIFFDICKSNIQYQNIYNQKLKPFISLNTSVKIKDYLERLYRYTKMESTTIVLILIYIDRICKINKFSLTFYIIHKFILSSMIMAMKYNEDGCFSIDYYAKLGGISTKEMRFLEYYFFSLINYELFVQEDLFNKYNDFISSNNNDEDDDDDDEDNDDDND